MSVEEAGRELGLGRSASYEAVRRGEIPSLRLGKRRVVPTAALRRLLGLDVDDAPVEAGASGEQHLGATKRGSWDRVVTPCDSSASPAARERRVDVDVSGWRPVTWCKSA